MATKKTGKRGNSEGSIRQRKDGRWEARLSYRDINGISRRKSFFGQTQREVIAKLAEARQQNAKGIQPTDDRLTFGKYLAGWLEHVAAPRLKPKTTASYRHLVKKHIGPGLGRVPLSKLDPATIRRFLTAKAESGLSGRTCQYLHAVIRKSLNDALKDGLLARNAAQLVTPPRAKGSKVEPLTPQQVRQFLGHVQGHRLEALFTVAAALGLRQGEIFALQWSDVDLAGRTLRVRHSLARVGGKILLDRPKSDAGIRDIMLPAVAVAALQAHRRRQEFEKQFAGERWQNAVALKDGQPVTLDLVFRSTIGTPLISENVTHEFQRLLKAAGLPRRRFHDLRHAAATLLMAQGLNARAIASILGWDQTILLDRYGHLIDEVRREAADLMDAILKPVGVTVGVKTKERAN
jgi:integrase